MLLYCGTIALGQRATCFAETPESARQQPELPKHHVVIVVGNGRRYDFNVEVAATAQQQTIGLMFRRFLPADGGMLFVWPRPWVAGMWMKNTRLPLDMLFIRSDGTIDTIVQNAEPETMQIRSSHEVVVATLELPGGTSGRLGIQEGDKVLGVPKPAYNVASIAVTWPGFQSSLQPGVTTSEIRAMLPPSVHIEQPGPDVPPSLGLMSGKWTGWLGRDRGGSVQLAVWRLRATEANVAYAFANSSRHVSSSTCSFQATFLLCGAGLAPRDRNDESGSG